MGVRCRHAFLNPHPPHPSLSFDLSQFFFLSDDNGVVKLEIMRDLSYLRCMMGDYQINCLITSSGPCKPCDYMGSHDMSGTIQYKNNFFFYHCVNIFFTSPGTQTFLVLGHVCIIPKKGEKSRTLKWHLKRINSL